ncbi:MAG: hypothetical protein Ta2E_00210 [Mycoplasmoidaceae bacterium]|nr:MAG: hypothetical protein Ta2E_00210 [Mycoplasmoidaceae bacterium]
MRTLTYSDHITINEIKYYIADDYSNLNPALFSALLDVSLSENITMNRNYCKRIYFQSHDPLSINSMSYNVSLWCGIKQYILSITFIDIETTITNEEENIWKTIYIVKMRSYGDYNSTSVFY